MNENSTGRKKVASGNLSVSRAVVMSVVVVLLLITRAPIGIALLFRAESWPPEDPYQVIFVAVGAVTVFSRKSIFLPAIALLLLVLLLNIAGFGRMLNGLAGLH